MNAQNAQTPKEEKAHNACKTINAGPLSNLHPSNQVVDF